MTPLVTRAAPQQYVDMMSIAMSNIFECANAFISLEDPMEIDDPMDVDGPSEMKQSIEVDPPAFVISVMVTACRPAFARPYHL
ncbi:hypothetical protein G6F56_002227 [Rhizopus delemar]|nr:hypothetical protein G6F56_002227 [Rhizopus delemar]